MIVIRVTTRLCLWHEFWRDLKFLRRLPFYATRLDGDPVLCRIGRNYYSQLRRGGRQYLAIRRIIELDSVFIRSGREA